MAANSKPEKIFLKKLKFLLTLYRAKYNALRKMAGNVSALPACRRHPINFEINQNVNDIQHNTIPMPPKETQIGNRLKSARAKLGLSQSEAAKAWKFSIKTIQTWEQGWAEPRGLYLEKLEKILQRIESQP
jgi:DNA-binding transcriptional regulator YiaG